MFHLQATLLAKLACSRSKCEHNMKLEEIVMVVESKEVGQAAQCALEQVREIHYTQKKKDLKFRPIPES